MNQNNKPSPNEAKPELSTWAFLILLAAFLLPGLIGRDPWKPDEGYYFGLVHSLLQSGDWVVPTLAGEPFMEKPPLIIWLGAACAWLTSAFLPDHDGARLAVALCMAGSLAALAAAGRRAYGLGAGRVAALASLTALGVLIASHMLIADVPLMLGFSLALWGFAWILSEPVKGGALLGVGVGVGFLAKGLLAPGAIGASALLLPILFRQWRTRTYLRGLMVAAVVSLPFLLIWPAMLYLRSPPLFMEWFVQNNIGRYLGFSVAKLGATATAGFWYDTLPWFTFPLWPLAIWGLIRERRALMVGMLPPVLQASWLLLLVSLAVLVTAASARAIYTLVLVPPLALLAVAPIGWLSERLSRCIDWVARILAGAFCALLWYGWAYALAAGAAPAWMQTRHLPRDFPFAGAGLGMASALVLAALWIALLPRLANLRARALVSWVAAVALCWGTVAGLWFPWIDAGKNYRALFLEVQAALPAERNCIQSEGLGESERAMLHYYTGILTHRHEVKIDDSCHHVIVQDSAGERPWWLEHGWKVLWTGARPGEKREHFWLFEDPALSRK